MYRYVTKFACLLVYQFTVVALYLAASPFQFPGLASRGWREVGEIKLSSRDSNPIRHREGGRGALLLAGQQHRSRLFIRLARGKAIDTEASQHRRNRLRPTHRIEEASERRSI